MEVIPTLQPVDLLLSDPPYGIGESSKKNASRGTSSAIWKRARITDYGTYDWDDEPPSAAQIASCAAIATWSILWGGNYFGLPAASKWLVWDKENTGDFADCELAWTNLPGAVRIFRHMWNGMLRASERNTPRVHPTQKPVVLMDWCIGQAGDVTTVFDPFMGSGTTGVSCANLGKSFIGIEREPRYFDIACERVKAAQAQTRLFV
jgi:site-specific DNA-methyltransferase (adenine-specific)/modification methylase